MSKAAYIPFYTSDFMGGTSGLSAAEKGVYITLLCLIYEAEDAIEVPKKILARRCGCTVSALKNALDALEADGKITIDGDRIWSEKCAKHLECRRERRSHSIAAANIRWQKDQQKQRKADATASVGQCQPEPEPYIKKETKVSQKRGSRLPDDWSLSEKNISDAQAQGLTTDEVRHEADKFRDYWISTAGAKGVKLDWDATWRNWCRNASKRTAQRPNRNAGPQSMADALAELRDDIERAERGGGPFSEGPSGHDGATIIELTPVGRGNGHRAQTGQQDGYGDGFGPDWVLPGQGFR